uniref:Transmembrane domain-containing protein n=1 Tax=Spironucleus salmonicida TaxID=348837 RepID=V6LY37_9EUKA|eukprot:EST49567.1 Transmembrane domain-containing protein [Spironucleus salmonicida]
MPDTAIPISYRSIFLISFLVQIATCSIVQLINCTILALRVHRHQKSVVIFSVLVVLPFALQILKILISSVMLTAIVLLSYENNSLFANLTLYKLLTINVVTVLLQLAGQFISAA